MILFNDIDKVNWGQMPFPKNWFDGVMADKAGQPRGYLKIEAFEHKDDDKGKKVYEFGDENQIMYWLKHSFAMLESGVFFNSEGEHKGYADGSSTELDETDRWPAWIYGTLNGVSAYETHAWNASADSLSFGGNSITANSILYPFFITKMRFGTDGPADITEPIDPSETTLDDSLAQGAGNTPGDLNFIMISRAQHIALTTTGFSTTSPTGYFDDFGSVFKNISVYQVTMPASALNFGYDGRALNEAGLYCDAALTGTKGGQYEMPYGMILAKRYFSPIQKTNTISINFQWSVIK